MLYVSYQSHELCTLWCMLPGCCFYGAGGSCPRQMPAAIALFPLQAVLQGGGTAFIRGPFLLHGPWQPRLD